MARPALIFTSHGFMAKETLASLEMILGYSIENCGVVSITEGKSYDQALSEIQALCSELDTSSGCLIFTDIYGGTPSNIATYLLLEHDFVEVITGLNLPIVLETLFKDFPKVSDYVEFIQSIKSQSILSIREKIKEREANGNQMDSY